MAALRIAAQRATPAALARSRALTPIVARVAATNVRYYSDKPTPEARASSLLDVLPGNSLLTKTGWVTFLGSASAVAISKELYVANEETVILAGFLIFATLVGRAVAGPYTEWADSQIAKIGGILNSAREEHTKAVQSRIDNVEKQRDVVDITKSLFAIGKQTAEIEKDVFELRQRTQIAAEVKNVLDSWVRYEAAEREEQQRALATAVIDKVMKSLLDEKTQKSILDDAVAEVEQLVKAKKI